ncbi:MAG: hypothetical protein HFF06_07555 [Oscillospiraceae bacterium]|jgi:hypothetical protein|nr:hypothetical protein [Oscillospiraceae bacterium]
MSKFIVQRIDSHSGEILDEMVDEMEFNTYKETEEYSLTCAGDFATGAEVLELAGRDFTNPDDVDFVVEEVV